MATNKFTTNKPKNEKPTAAATPVAKTAVASPVARTEAPIAKPASPAFKATAPMKSKSLTMPSDEEIRTRAYEIFVSEGCQEGQDLQYWLRAERELRQSASH